MKLITFRSSKGDCLLISNANADGTNSHILVDGGMSTSFKENVADYLSENIRAKNEVINLLCVSHIDDDHIVGVLTLMNLIVEWRVYEFHKRRNARNKKPKLPKPPEITTVWHNSFAKSYDLGDALPKVEQALHNIQQITALHTHDELICDVHDKATSIKKGITLSQRLRPEQLGIPLNQQYNGRLIKCNQSNRSKNKHKVGDTTLTVLGPFSSDLKDLKEKWIDWENSEQAALKEFYRDLSITAVKQPLDTLETKRLLIQSGSIDVDLDLGERGDVSIPNLASIMFLLESNSKKILMTGDGHAEDILKGLKKNGKLSNSESIHVNVLKVQHHGASANISKDFCKKVTADYYVFCGNGTHHNPEIEVLEIIFNSRKGTPEHQSFNAEVGNNFEFWLNVNPEDKLTKNQTKQIKAVKDKLEELQASLPAGDNSFKFKFIPKNHSFMTLDLS